jgi:hypothetical protein
MSSFTVSVSQTPCFCSDKVPLLTFYISRFKFASLEATEISDELTKLASYVEKSRHISRQSDIACFDLAFRSSLFFLYS